MKYFHLIWSALMRRKARTLFTMLSVLAAFLLFGMLDSVRTAFAEAGHSVSGASQLITMSKLGFGNQLPLGLQAQIARIPGVAAVAHVDWFGGIYQDPKNFFPNEAVSGNYFEVQDAGTLLFSGNSMLTVNPYTFKSLPYDPKQGFTPLGTVAIMPLVLLTTPTGPANVAEFIAKAKAEPGKWSFGSYGLGNAPHFAGEMLNREAGIQMVHVPFSGSAPNLTALLGGQIPVSIDSVLASAPHIKAGKLKPLATFSQKRLPNYPNLPTIGEAGYPKASIDSWLLFLAPPKLNPEVHKKLNDALAELAKRPDIVQKIIDLNLVPHYEDSAQTQAHIARELAEMKDISAKAGIQPQ